MHFLLDVVLGVVFYGVNKLFLFPTSNLEGLWLFFASRFLFLQSVTVESSNRDKDTSKYASPPRQGAIPRFKNLMQGPKSGPVCV